jgi:protease I
LGTNRELLCPAASFDAAFSALQLIPHMPSGVNGRKIAFFATDGVEERELVEPWDALSSAGAVVHLVSLRAGEIQATRDGHPAGRFKVDRVLHHARAGDYDGLVLPGGAENPARLDADSNVVGFLRAFMDSDKPVCAIGDAAWLLIEADEVRGRSMTSSRSLRTDIQNAGGVWVDRPVETDQRLVTSRGPDDLRALCGKLLEVFEQGIDERRLDSVVEQSFPASDPPPGPAAPA